MKGGADEDRPSQDHHAPAPGGQAPDHLIDGGGRAGRDDDHQRVLPCTCGDRRLLAGTGRAVRLCASRPQAPAAISSSGCLANSPNEVAQPRGVSADSARRIRISALRRGPGQHSRLAGREPAAQVPYRHAHLPDQQCGRHRLRVRPGVPPLPSWRRCQRSSIRCIIRARLVRPGRCLVPVAVLERAGRTRATALPRTLTGAIEPMFRCP
jgi:hypothetical protein